MKNNKIHCLHRVSRVVLTSCVYGGFWSGLDANYCVGITHLLALGVVKLASCGTA